MTIKLVALVLPVALLMIAAVPAEAADVKELFAIELADNPGKEVALLRCHIRPAHETWSIGTTPTRSSTCSKAKSSCS